jgi:hypothetical protein
MHPLTELPVPILKRIIGFWLTSLLVGSITIFLYTILGSKDFDKSLLLITAVTICTVAFSLPSLLLLYVLFPWALASPSLTQRWFRLLSVQGISAGTAFELLHYTILNNRTDSNIPLITGSYSLAGLVVAYWYYSAWLTRSV